MRDPAAPRRPDHQRDPPRVRVRQRRRRPVQRRPGLGRAAARRLRPLGPPHPRRPAATGSASTSPSSCPTPSAARGGAGSPTSPSAAPGIAPSSTCAARPTPRPRAPGDRGRIVDELAAAAELVMGKATGVPVAIVRGVDPAWLGEGPPHATSSVTRARTFPMIPSTRSPPLPVGGDARLRRAGHLAEAIAAVLASPWVAELVVVDDCSTDGTPTSSTGSPTSGSTSCATASTRARAPRCAPASPRPRSTTWSSRTPTSSTTPPSTPRSSAPARRQGRRGLRLALRRRRVPSRPLLLALGRQQAAHPGLQHGDQPQPHRHGDLLQGVPHASPEPGRDRGGPLRVRARDHRQAGPLRRPLLRGRHLLRRPHLRRGQEDRLARRRAGGHLHRQLRGAPPAVHPRGAATASARPSSSVVHGLQPSSSQPDGDR